MTTYDVESPTVSQYRKFPSSYVSSTPVLGTFMIRGESVLKGWATENAARGDCLLAVLAPLPASSGGKDHTAHHRTGRAPSINTGNTDVWMLPCEAATLV